MLDPDSPTTLISLSFPLPPQLSREEVILRRPDVPAKVLAKVSQYWECLNQDCKKIFWEGPKFDSAHVKFANLISELGEELMEGGGGGVLMKEEEEEEEDQGEGTRKEKVEKEEEMKTEEKVPEHNNGFKIAEVDQHHHQQRRAEQCCTIF